MTFHFTNQESGISYDFTVEELRHFLKASGMSAEEFADYSTGFTCDSYADATVDLAEEFNGDTVEACDGNRDLYETCRTYHRILNLDSNLTCEQVQQAWEEDFHVIR